MKIKVYDTTREYATTSDRGQRLYDLIVPLLRSGEQVELDFDGVDIFVSDFWSHAIGQLLRDFTVDELNRLLKIEGLPEYQRHVLKKVIDRNRRAQAPVF